MLYGKRGWHAKHPAQPRPLYGLDRLATRPNARVLVCEGETAADAATRLFPEWVCITWPAGAGNVAHADWGPLKGRLVVIWPDADHAGIKAAGEIAARLANVRVA